MGKSARKAWAVRAFSELKTHVKANDKVVFLAGQSYREFLVDLIYRIGCQIEIPMEGLRIGEQMQWLNYHLKERGYGSSE